MNVRKRIGHFFLAAVPVVLPLFSESAFVEIQKVPSNYLIRVRSCKFPLLIVFSQPGLSNKNRPVFTFYRYLDVLNLNLSEKKFCQIWLQRSSKSRDSILRVAQEDGCPTALS